MNSIRLITDSAAEGAWNMAVDQSLLQSANELGQATLRIYRWSPATLSLGYFQKYDDRSKHPASSDCDVVRRSSGGGAILHDQELTYSLCLPSSNRWSDKNEMLYRLMHRLIISVLADFEVNASTFDPASPLDDPGEFQIDRNAFLCFQRRTDGDIVLDGWKVGGSAQRRLDKALIQHGSLLLKRSEFAPELPGIVDLSSGFDVRSFEEQFCPKLCQRLGNELSVDFISGQVSELEKSRARDWVSGRFLSDNWTRKR